jgi:hypothetical protein
MKLIENLIRRILFTFSLASFVTMSFNQKLTSLTELAWITWALFAVLFLLSWRLAKEFNEIFIKDVEEDRSMWGQFEKRNPWLASFTWQCFITLAAIHVFYLALDGLSIMEVNGKRVELFVYAFGLTLLFRLIDQHTYRKK